MSAVAADSNSLIGDLAVRPGGGTAAVEMALADGVVPSLADTLIAQCCMDSDVPLITVDADFRHFVSRGLRLVV